MYGKCMCEYAKKLRFIVLFHISYFANRFVFLFAAKICIPAKFKSLSLLYFSLNASWTRNVTLCDFDLDQLLDLLCLSHEGWSDSGGDAVTALP